jgi:hypothetical protein
MKKIKQIKVYSYDPNSKEYNGEINANESPLEPGKFLLPANSTKIKPILKKEKICLFKDGSWQYSDIIKTISLPKAITIEEERKLKIGELVIYYHCDEVRKTKISHQDTDYFVLNNSKLRNFITNQIIILKAKNVRTNENKELFFKFKIDDDFLNLNLSQLESILLVLEDKRKSQFYNKEKHLLNISKLKTIKEIKNYNLFTGW